MSQYIQVAEDDSNEAMEVPSEEDGTLLLTTLSAQFPGACGLKYRNHETGTLRGIRLSDGRLYPPDTDWGRQTYIVVFPKGKKHYAHNMHSQFVNICRHNDFILATNCFDSFPLFHRAPYRLQWYMAISVATSHVFTLRA